MVIIFQMLLVIVNGVLAAMNYSNGSMGVALFNAATAGFCFAMAIATAHARRG